MMFLTETINAYFVEDVDKLRPLYAKDESKPVLAVDFDSTLSQLDAGKDFNSFYGTPIPGAQEWMQEMVQYFNIVIFTSRCLNYEGVKNIHAWLLRYDFPINIFVTNVKIPARYYIDDRAYRFTGNNYPSVEEVQNFTSWDK